MNFQLVLEHLYLVLVSSIFATIIGLILGVIVYFFKSIRPAILKIIDIIQTIPALAILGLLMIIFGGTSTTVIIGLVLYSLLPIVNNTYVGLKSIDSGIKEAAIGMGMTKMQKLFQVELPLAFPMVFTGIRIAIVNSIGTAVFGSFVGGGGLGAIINRAILIQDMSTLILATLSLMIMAIIFDYGMGAIEKKLKIHF
ncbi:ABC transporter permease [Garciella nitratireducens]|uniref:Osmoprotectant transport system permease protein n=1 Tax=Garciella nitratireducens DSM 15102 TaxID=1121911 RepID=A0A1T4KJG0_9FIRM|nr:ABC transporter permease [Garciella nitratireducens]SJZ42517.1 osmoprotectant transport system permease protein [Garciella nitratireducens DSM 15102]